MKKVYKDARTGKFVTREYAEEHKYTTFLQSLSLCKKKKIDTSKKKGLASKKKGTFSRRR